MHTKGSEKPAVRKPTSFCPLRLSAQEYPSGKIFLDAGLGNAGLVGCVQEACGRGAAVESGFGTDQLGDPCWAAAVRLKQDNGHRSLPA